MMRKILKQAFTLIELLVVIAIIGILSGLIVVSMSGVTNKANVAKAQVFSNSLRNSLMLDLVSEWKFNENTGSTAADSWNGGNTGTLVGATHLPVWKTGSNCVDGSCLSFDGIDDRVDISYIPDIIVAGGYTMTAWFKKTGGTSGTIINISDASANRNGIIFNSNTIVCGYYNGTSYVAVNYSNASSNAWHYVACTNTSGVISLYIDGVSVNSGTSGLGLGSAQNYIGYNSNAGLYFTGLIDDIRIYDAAIPTSQIKEQYYAGLNKLLASGRINEKDYIEKINAVARQ
jgi:prepilin-type N-terminal cleavage/methylation domain-containing protein